MWKFSHYNYLWRNFCDTWLLYFLVTWSVCILTRCTTHQKNCPIKIIYIVHVIWSSNKCDAKCLFLFFIFLQLSFRSIILSKKILFSYFYFLFISLCFLKYQVRKNLFLLFIYFLFIFLTFYCTNNLLFSITNLLFSLTSYFLF